MHCRPFDLPRLLAAALAAALLPACAGVQPLRPAVAPSRLHTPERSAAPRATPVGRETAAPNQHQTLTLADCVRIAQAQNPAARSARFGVAAARESEGEAQAPYLPEVSLHAGYDRFRSHAFLPSAFSRTGIPSTIGPTDDWSAGVRARLLLFDSGRRRSDLAAARARRGAAEEVEVETREDLALRVHDAFYGLGAAQETERVAKENLARTKDHRRLAAERKAAGAVPKIDVVRTEVEVADARLALVRVRSLVRITRGRLNTLLGRPVEMETRIRGMPEPLSSPEAFDLGQAMGRAVRARPALRAALRRVEARRSAVAAARSGFGPKVLADGGYGWRDDRFLPVDEEWSVGVSVELPLFSGFATAHAVGRARAEEVREEADLEREILDVRQEVWAAHSVLREAYEAIQAADALVVQAREGLRLARERYQVGAGTVSELLDAETALARAEADRVGTGWDYRTAVARFRWSAGDLTGRPPKGGS